MSQSIQSIRERLEEKIRRAEQRLNDIHYRKMEVVQHLAEEIDRRRLIQSRQEIEQHD